MNWTKAIVDDARRLAEMNHHLIQDEGHRNPMTVSQLEERMRNWSLSGEYEAVLFGGPPAIAYALFRREPDSIYIRQFFVERSLRRKGVGHAAIATLIREVLPQGTRITLEVLANNDAAVAFWASLGFQQYAITMELPPNRAS